MRSQVQPCNWVERTGGSVHEMGGQDHCPVGPGDVFVLETPSGGGYGPPVEPVESEIESTEA